MTGDDVTKLVSLVGRSGTVHALVGSRMVKIEDLRTLAKSLDLTLTRASKKELASKIVRRVDRRITKPLDELEAMNQEELLSYLKATNCDAEDLKELLKKADLPIQSKMSHRELLMFAAIQISSLGMFKRISNSHCSSDQHTLQNRIADG